MPTASRPFSQFAIQRGNLLLQLAKVEKCLTYLQRGPDYQQQVCKGTLQKSHGQAWTRVVLESNGGHKDGLRAGQEQFRHKGGIREDKTEVQLGAEEGQLEEEGDERQDIQFGLSCKEEVEGRVEQE